MAPIWAISERERKDAENMQLFQRLNCVCVLFMVEADENVAEDSSLSVAALSRSIEYKMKWNK